MKNRLVSTIIMTSLALQLVACGGADKAQNASAAGSATEAEQTEGVADSNTEDSNTETESAAETSTEEANTTEDTGSDTTTEAADSEDKAGDENTQIANPWRDCTEEEAKAACPRLFKAPEEDLVSSWSIMDVKDSEEGVPGPVVELDFRMDGKDFTARAQYGAPENEDISGTYYDWDLTDDITLANWGEGNMKGKYSRHLEDGWTVDLITWYDIEIGIAYSLEVEAEDLDGFDLQAIAEQMYNPDNEPLTGETTE